MVIMIQLTRQMIIQFISILDIEVPIATISKTNMKTVCKCVSIHLLIFMSTFKVLEYICRSEIRANNQQNCQI